jgi:hypothetical protein
LILCHWKQIRNQLLLLLFLIASKPAPRFVLLLAEPRTRNVH